MPTITPPGDPYLYGRSEHGKATMQGDVHWRQPDGTLACGAPHLDAASDSLWFTCCRQRPGEATCRVCVEQASVDRIITALAVAS